MIFSIPWWVLLIVLFICFSAFMAIRAILAERKLEQQFIEREGEIYMKRLREEKAKRQQSSE